jgi:hypothetical protein
MPIRGLLKDGSFAAEQVEAITTAFEDCLTNLQLVDRDDPVVMLVAQRVVDLARRGECDPSSLRNAVLKSLGHEHPQHRAMRDPFGTRRPQR